MWDRLCDVLTDFEFLRARLGASPHDEPASTVHELLEDYLAVLEALPPGHAGRPGLEMLGRAIDRNAHVLGDFPRLLVQQLANAWNVCRLQIVGR